MTEQTRVNILRFKGIGVFSIALLIIISHLVGGSLMSQLHAPLYLFQEDETFYRVYSSAGISHFITSHFFISLLFDICLFATPLLYMLSSKRGFAIAFTLLAITYFITYNMVTGHHYHGFIGVIIISIPFWFKKERRFNAMWELARYYWLYVFASAALWKILRGSVFYKDQLSNILKAQQLDLLLQSPGSFHTQAVQYLIAHPGVSHLVLIANVVLQLSFLIGFFTKKCDGILFWLAIIFCAANYFVMSIISVELLILNLTLINFDKRPYDFKGVPSPVVK